MTPSLEAWNGRLAEAMDGLGGSAFPALLENALRSLVDFDICMVFAYSDDRRGFSLYHNMDSPTARVVVEDYLAGPFLLDPFYEEVKRGRREGFRALRDLAPDRFYQSQYYRHHYVRTGIADEMGLFFGIAPDTTAVLSVTRPKRKRLFSRAERLRFATAAPVVRALGSIQWAERRTAGPHRLARRSPARSAIETAFNSFGRDVLTARECEVVTLVLIGHSSDSIAQVLEISPGTVKIHRKHAYTKLGISSQAQLFSVFLSSLRRTLSVDGG